MKKMKLALIAAATAFTITSYANAATDNLVKNNDAIESIHQRGKNVTIQGADINQTVRMNGGTLTVQGAGCNIRVIGFADRIVIQGADTEVHVDKVNSIKIEGADTHVYYKTSDNKNGRAAVNVFGAGSGAHKVK